MKNRHWNILVVLSIIILLTSIGYNEEIVEAVSDITAKNPPPFSFLDCDPNNTSTEYVERMKEYDRVIKLCPIPIYVMDFKDLPKELRSKNKPNKITIGKYCYDKHVIGWPSEFILLDKKLNPYSMMSTYFHEYQHYQCRLTKCECREWITKKVRRKAIERCAIRAELRISIYRNDPFILLEAIKVVEDFSNCDDKECSYKSASQSIMKSALWKEASIYKETLMGVLNK